MSALTESAPQKNKVSLCPIVILSSNKAFIVKCFTSTSKTAARTSDMIAENSTAQQIAEGTKMSQESPGQRQQCKGGWLPD
jgi:hypothetical protein